MFRELYTENGEISEDNFTKMKKHLQTKLSTCCVSVVNTEPSPKPEGVRIHVALPTDESTPL